MAWQIGVDVGGTFTDLLVQLDLFWSKRLGSSRKGTRWDQVVPTTC